MTVDRARFERACRIELSGLTYRTFPSRSGLPGFTVPYTTLALLDSFITLPLAQQREIMWMLGLFVEEEAPPAPPPQYPTSPPVSREPIARVEGRLPLDLDQTPATNGKATALHDGWRCRVCGKGITEVSMCRDAGAPNPKRPCRSCKRALEIHVYGPLRRRFPRMTRDSVPGARDKWSRARDLGFEHVANWTRNRPHHADADARNDCPVCTMTPVQHPVEALR